MYIGVIYNSTKVVPLGREIEKLADSEIWDTAVAVKSALEKKGHQVDLVTFEADQVEELCKYEWIFNLAETIYGFPFADYQIAEIMEGLGIPFTGSGSATLRTCLYKSATKTQIQNHGIRTPRYEMVDPGDTVKTNLAFPLIVKPDHEDGGIGIKSDSVVQSMPELVRKISEIHQIYGQAALLEEFIDGRDITVSIIGNGDDLTVFPLSEIIFSDDYLGPRILTFEEKWVEESPAYQKSVARCPCSMDEKSQAEINNIAIRLFKILGCRDYAIVDFRLKGDEPYVIEVNPNPCINPINSGFITEGAVYGFSYDEIINEILKRSMLRCKIVLDR
jgi:D-alanine-D-alanine ligase and related ATP-grasp enzymes